MKKNFIHLIICVCLLAYLPLTAQYTLPEFGEDPVITDYTGTISDHGGPTGNHNNNIDGQVTIAPVGSTELVLTVTAFEFECCCDFLYVHDGLSTSDPLIGEVGYNCTDLPGPDGDGVFVATSGAVTIRMTSDVSVTFAGFEASWSACNPTTAASFMVADNNPPVNASLTFMNTSIGTISSVWEFGDGSTSTENIPSHAYDSPGTYTVTLTVTNECTGDVDVYSEDIVVQDSPQITIDPASVEVNLNYGETTTVDLTIANAGEGDLLYSIDGTTNVEILSLVNGADMEDEYPNTIAAIEATFPNFNEQSIIATDSLTLATALVGKDVLLIPEQEDCDPTIFAALAPAIYAFVEAGGTVIINGTSEYNCVLNLGLFNGSYQGFTSSDELILSIPDDPLLEGVSAPYIATPSTFYYNITNPDAVNVVSFLDDGVTMEVVSYRNIGEGRAIFIGHDYRFSNPNLDRVIGNAVKNANKIVLEENPLLWFDIAPLDGIVAGGDAANISLDFSAVGVYDGTYTIDLIVVTNDPVNPQIIVPCTLTIANTPPFIVLPSTHDFGPLMIGNTISQEFTIVNTTENPIDISEIVFDESVFSANPSTISLSGNGAQTITVTFTPDAITTHNSNMTLNSAASSFVVSLQAEGLGAPTASIAPNEISVTVDAGTSTVVPLTLSNSGEGPMDFTVDTLAFINNLEVLFYTYGVDLVGEYPNMITAIETYVTDYSATETNTTDPDELATLLEGKQVFLIGENETGDSNVFTDLAPVLQDFVEAGGNVIFTGTFGALPLINSGLMPNAFESFDGGSNIVVNPDHPITADLPENFSSPNATIPVNTDLVDGVEVLVEQAGGTVVAYKTLGSGRVIYLGFDYFENTEVSSLILSNTLTWIKSAAVVSWLSVSPTAGTLGFPEDLVLDVTLDATDLLGGTYISEVVVNTNDPLMPTIVVPVSLVVVGVAEITTDVTSIDFGEVIIGNAPSLSFTISNPGTDSLFITNISSDLSQFGLDVTTITLPPPSGNVVVTVTFTPDAIADFNGTITIENNVNIVSIPVTGIGLGTPVITIDANTVETTLLAGDAGTATVLITNDGEGTLGFYLEGEYPEWLSVPAETGTVAAGESVNLDLNFDATGLLAGTYTYDLVIYSDDPNTPQQIISVTLIVEAFPQAGLAAAAPFSCDGEVVFTDASLNEPSSWTWYFGDGNTSNEQNPEHTYANDGVYTVSLSACNDLGCDSTGIADYITVEYGSTACDTVLMPISGTQLYTRCNGVLLDSGGITGEYQNQENGTIVIAPVGATSITLNFSDFNLEQSFDNLLVYDGNPITGTLLGTFSGTELPNGDGIVTSNTGEMHINMTTDGSVTRPGFLATWECIVIDAPPIVAFEYEIINECTGEVTFTDVSENYPDEFEWTIVETGEVISFDEETSYSFPASGTYEVQLSACNIVDCATAIQEVTIDNVLQLEYEIPCPIVVGIPVAFVDNTAGATSWQWNFGNANQSVLQNAVTFYTTPGEYDVSLTVTTATCERTAQVTICVDDGSDTCPACPDDVGITVVNNNEFLQLTPNPSTGNVFMNYTFEGNEVLDIQILDAMGKLVYTEKTAAQNVYQKTLNLAKYPKGLYVVNVRSADTVATQKLLLH